MGIGLLCGYGALLAKPKIRVRGSAPHPKESLSSELTATGLA